MAYVIGIDHGNGNMKTENTIFPCGYKMQETPPNPMFSTDILEYNGKYYTLSSTRFPYQTDKTLNDNAFILTLFSIAKEIIAREGLKKDDYDVKRDFDGFIGKDVVLAVGLPPTHFEKQSKPFKNYFLKHAEHGVNYKYNNKPFSFYIKDVFVYPQDYAGAVVFRSEELSEYSQCYCIDIGDGTTDMVGLVNGKPEKDTMLSRECGMSKLRSAIIDDIINDYNMTLDDKTVEDFLNGRKIALAPDIADKIHDRIDKTAEQFTIDLVNQLHSKVPDFRVFLTIFCGGGAMALKKYLDKTGMFGVTDYITEINANAIGYQQIAQMQLSQK